MCVPLFLPLFLLLKLNFLLPFAATVAVVDFLLEEKNKSSLDDVCKLTRQNVGAANESKIMVRRFSLLVSFSFPVADFLLT